MLLPQAPHCGVCRELVALKCWNSAALSGGQRLGDDLGESERNSKLFLYIQNLVPPKCYYIVTRGLLYPFVLNNWPECTQKLNLASLLGF